MALEDELVEDDDAKKRKKVSPTKFPKSKQKKKKSGGGEGTVEELSQVGPPTQDTPGGGSTKRGSKKKKGKKRGSKEKLEKHAPEQVPQLEPAKQEVPQVGSPAPEMPPAGSTKRESKKKKGTKKRGSKEKQEKHAPEQVPQLEPLIPELPQVGSPTPEIPAAGSTKRGSKKKKGKKRGSKEKHAPEQAPQVESLKQEVPQVGSPAPEMPAASSTKRGSKKKKGKEKRGSKEKQEKHAPEQVPQLEPLEQEVPQVGSPTPEMPAASSAKRGSKKKKGKKKRGSKEKEEKHAPEQVPQLEPLQQEVPQVGSPTPEMPAASSAKRGSKKKKGKKKRGSKEKEEKHAPEQVPQLEPLGQEVPQVGSPPPEMPAASSPKRGSKEKKGKKKRGSKGKKKKAEPGQAPALEPLSGDVPSQEIFSDDSAIEMKTKPVRKGSKEKTNKKKKKELSKEAALFEGAPLEAQVLDSSLAKPEADTKKKKGSKGKKSKKTKKEKKDVDVSSPSEPPFPEASSWTPTAETPSAESELTKPRKKKGSKGKKAKKKKPKMEETVSPQEPLPEAAHLELHPAGPEIIQGGYEREIKKKTRKGSKVKSKARSPLARLGKFFRSKTDHALEDVVSPALESPGESNISKRKKKKKKKSHSGIASLSPEEASLEHAGLEQTHPATALPFEMPPGDIGSPMIEVGADKKKKKKKKEFAELGAIAGAEKQERPKGKKGRKKRKGDSTPDEGSSLEGSQEEVSPLLDTFPGKKTKPSIGPDILDGRAAEKERRNEQNKASPPEQAGLAPISSVCSVCMLSSASVTSGGTLVRPTPISTPAGSQRDVAPRELNSILKAIADYCASASKTGELGAKDLNFTIMGESPLGPPGSTVRVVRGDSALTPSTGKSALRPLGPVKRGTRSTISIPPYERASGPRRRKRPIQRRSIGMMPGTQSTISIPPRKGSVVISVTYPDESTVPNMTVEEGGGSFLPPSRSYSCSHMPPCSSSAYCDDNTFVSGRPPYDYSSRSCYRTEQPEMTCCDCGESFFPDDSEFFEYPPDRYHLPSGALRDQFSVTAQPQMSPSLPTAIPPTLQIMMEPALSASRIQKKAPPEPRMTVPPAKKHRKSRKQERPTAERGILAPTDLLKEQVSLQQRNKYQQDREIKDAKNLPNPLMQQMHEILQVLQQPHITAQSSELQKQPFTLQLQQPLELEQNRTLQQIQQPVLAELLQKQAFEQAQQQQYRQQSNIIPEAQPQSQQTLLYPNIQLQEQQLLQPSPESQTSAMLNAPQTFHPTQQQGLQWQPYPTQQQPLQLPPKIAHQGPSYASAQVNYERRQQLEQQCLLELQQELKQELQKQMALQLSQQQPQPWLSQQQGLPRKKSKIVLIHQQLQPDEYIESVVVDGQPCYSPFNRVDPSPGVTQQLQLPVFQQPGNFQQTPETQLPHARAPQFQVFPVSMQYTQMSFQRP